MIRVSLLALLLAGSASAAMAQADPHAGHTRPAPQPGPAVANPHAGHQMPPPAAASDPHAGRLAPAGQPDSVPAQGGGDAPADPHAGHATPAQPADPHAGHQMPAAAADPHAGHVAPTVPGGAAADPHAGHQMSGANAPADPHAGHVMPVAPTADPHAGHAMSAGADGQTGADLPVGTALAPPLIRDNMADQVYDLRAMQRARSILEDEHGGARVSKLQADVLEWAPKGDGYRWDVEGRYGGDLNRFAVKTEGEGRSGEGVESAEVQLLYSRAVTRYTDLQAGIRYDLEPQGRAYATVGVDALFPYWFEAEGALFLSEKGDLLGRLQGSYDFRLTQRLVLQPRTELEFAAQDIPDSQIGSGLSRGEFGLRLRYELRREFAPYVGVSYERAFGDTADFVRARGERAASTRFVVGLRAWF
jgi:copper resistance protein B